jgi:hypothetical protein
MVEECGMMPNDSVENISILSTQRKQNLASWGLPDTILKVCMCTGSYVRGWLYNNAFVATKIIIMFMAAQLPTVICMYG